MGAANLSLERGEKLKQYSFTCPRLPNVCQGYGTNKLHSKNGDIRVMIELWEGFRIQHILSFIVKVIIPSNGAFVIRSLQNYCLCFIAPHSVSLSVVDVYQEWSGPSKAMLPNFRRMRNELSDDLLRFAVVSGSLCGAVLTHCHAGSNRSSCLTCHDTNSLSFIILVMEVYQAWSGKSQAMLTILKDCLVKLEHDKMLKLAAVSKLLSHFISSYIALHLYT